MSDNSAVTLGIAKDDLLDILRHAASQERTVIEFRTTESDNGRELDQALDITEHVEQLEKERNGRK